MPVTNIPVYETNTLSVPSEKLINVNPDIDRTFKSVFCEKAKLEYRDNFLPILVNEDSNLNVEDKSSYSATNSPPQVTSFQLIF